MESQNQSQRQIVLHHYPASPYCEKVRLFLSYKKISWLSVITPSVSPKPDLTILTGGYRRAPVMQIGSDIYCDSQLILDVLDSMYPEPNTSQDSSNAASARLLGELVDVDLFLKVVCYSFGLNAAKISQEFIDDRAVLFPQLNFTKEDLVSTTPYLEQNLKLRFPFLAMSLGEKKYFGGEFPSLGDFAIYHIFWFLHTNRKFKPFTQGLTNFQEWFERMKSIAPAASTLSDSKSAIEIAHKTEPNSLSVDASDPLWGDFKPGEMVKIHPENFPHELIHGKLAQLTNSEIILSNHSDLTGTIHIHFPKVRYQIRRD